MSQTVHQIGAFRAPHCGVTLHASLLELFAHQYRSLIRRWNWKTALLSTLFRGAIFFAVNLHAGWDAATAALLTEFVYRASTAGFYGAITQSLRRVEPAWKAALAGLLLLPLFQHSLEYAVHWLRGTPHVGASVAVSACFTALSTLFNLYAMRRGAMVVDDAAPGLGDDLKLMPALVAGFVLAVPLRLYRAIAVAGRAS